MKVKNYEYVTCRALGHAWEVDDKGKPSKWGRTVWLECARCEMRRKDIVDLLGQIGSRYYVQPEGYRNPDVTDRAAYRIEMLRRAA